MKKEMLINAAQPEECRIAILEDGVLEELYVERANQETYVGNIYKGKIVNIEPSIQAAFVDFGGGRNGFLHVSDVDPAYFKHLLPKDVAAQLEAEQDEEFGVDRPDRGSRDRGDRGGRGERGRGRGDRGERGDRDRDRGRNREQPPAEPAADQPQELTSWLEPQAPPAQPAPRPAAARPAAPPRPQPQPQGFDEDGGFGTGLIEDLAHPAPEHDITEDAVVEEVEYVEVEEEEVPPAEIVTHVAPAVLLPAPAVARPLPPARVPTPPPPDDEEEGGFGAGLLDDVVVESVIELEVASSEPGESATLEVAEAADADEKKPRPRTRSRAKPKAEEGTPTAEGDDAAKKPRVRRKKKDDDAGEEPPALPIAGAEHRTTGDDSEPEITPFFTDSSGFDPDAPNDRFDASHVAEEEGATMFGEEEPEPAAEGAEEATEQADPDMVIGRGFNDSPDGEYVGADERRDRRGGGRGDRGGDRGGRGRGDRGDRGDRRGGDRGGDRGDRRPSGGPRFGGPRREREFPRLPIEKIFKRGQEVIVQVIKEGIGTKVPTLSTKVSIAGRYLVLMPSLARVGVSRKIEDPEARRRLRDIMGQLKTPKGVGFIVRTAAIDREAEELQADLVYLLRLWQVVARRIRKVSAPVECYRESDMITRTIRDIFTKDVDTIWVDDPTAFQHASEFLQIVMPKFANRIKLHEEIVPLFHKYKVEEEIAKINQKRIDLPRGGSIIIEQTEALVAIDVNSGTFRADNNAEETAFQMNMIAAKEIARQLRLRDLGGVIVNDFIDMRGETHRRKVEDCLRDALLRDKARTKILRISQFGIIEMTRQRLRPSLKKRIYSDCGHCKGTGYVKTCETTGIDVLRLLHLAVHRAGANANGPSSVSVSVHPEAAFHLLNKQRREIATLEEKGRTEITILAVPNVSPDYLELKCHDANGNEVRLLPTAPPPKVFGGGRPPRDRGDRGDRERGERDRDRERRYPAPLD
ncbi:Rne/Rng family ribonuclease [Limnoglobus roseus]|uniref:Ribonuclease G n=1 Tax=Limnoglobus roseus TaxID=2598579 RepID=A0A5C1AA30_9BACT|nr:Rne/Rng family ribonuclease [Limnoglobus roseus]QEL14886.1 ribonuclease E [Limnoglobus roseus]